MKMDIKVEIYKDKMVLRHAGGDISVRPARPYSSTRLLIGTFVPAVECLKEGLREIGVKGFFKSKPTLNIKPCELTEGGLSEIEERCLQELGYSAGAGRVNLQMV